MPKLSLDAPQLRVTPLTAPFAVRVPGVVGGTVSRGTGAFMSVWISAAERARL